MSEPMPIGDVIKETRSRWPRLAAKAETDSSEPEPPPSRPEPPPVRVESRSSADRTPSSDSESRTSGSGVRPLKPMIDPSKPLCERLWDLFGGGENPSLRRSLYLRCQSTVQIHGRPAELLLAEVVQAALEARRPGNYFAFAIVRRFRENGFVREV